MLKNNKIISILAVSYIAFSLFRITPVIAGQGHEISSTSSESIMIAKEDEGGQRRHNRKAKWNNMSSEERKAFRQKHKGQIQERLKNMSPEERDAFKAKHRKRMKNREQSITSEERKSFKEKRREKMKAKWSSMSDEERKSFRQKHKGQIKERMQKMSPERREKFKEHRQGRKQKMQRHEGRNQIKSRQKVHGQRGNSKRVPLINKRKN